MPMDIASIQSNEEWEKIDNSGVVSKVMLGREKMIGMEYLKIYLGWSMLVSL